MVPCKRHDNFAQGILKRFSSRDNSANRDDAISVKPLEVFSITVKERIFVIPFNLQGKCACRKPFGVINFVENGFLLFSIHDFFDLEVVLSLTVVIRQYAPKSLGELALTSAAANQFLGRNPCAGQNRFKFCYCISHVMSQDRCRVVQSKNLQAIFR
jgi:hypothetical protein